MAKDGEIDTLVLGCNPLMFVQDELRRLLGPGFELIATGEPVARQTGAWQTAGTLAPDGKPAQLAITLLTTGAWPRWKMPPRWLQLHVAAISAKVNKSC